MFISSLSLFSVFPLFKSRQQLRYSLQIELGERIRLKKFIERMERVIINTFPPL